uniref:Trichome birefringence-like N-terminal domain-containing protein n=1 Tax=Oryza punctata TaxID=4537 RepID=A0A0E0L9R5_ORYPU
MKKPAIAGMAPLPPSPPSCKAGGGGSPRSLLHGGGGEWSVVLRRNVKSSLLLLLVFSTFFVFSVLHSSQSFVPPPPAAASGEALSHDVAGGDGQGDGEHVAVAVNNVAAERSTPDDISLPSTNSSAAPVPTPSKAEQQQTDDAGVSMEEKCDMSMGKWVREPKGPVYTNMTCPTLPDYKNCQKHGKDPGHLYWRWQPDGCDLPRFSPERFLAAAETPTEVYRDAHDKFQTWRFPSHEFTLMVMWTEFYVHAEPVVGADGKPTPSFDIHLDRLSANWTRHLPELDYVVISGGNWFNRPNYLWEGGRRVGCVKCSVANLTDFGVPYAVRRVVRAAVEGIARCRGCKSGLVAFLRTFSPDHFEHGAWFSGGYCNRTRPLEEAEVRPDSAAWELRRVQREEVMRARETAAAAASGSGRTFGLLDVTKAMMLRADGHPGAAIDKRWQKNIVSDCLHWCMPGPVDMWNEMLLYRLTEISTLDQDALSLEAPLSHGTGKRMLQQQRSEAVEEKKKKPWAVSKNAALFVLFVLVLPALMILAGVSHTPAAATRLSWTMLGTLTARGAVQKRAEENNNCDTSPSGPAYTSMTCPTLPDSKNCHKYGKDPGHLHWRWRPGGCDLPRSSPARFLAAVRGKRLAFIGDSLARNHMESLLCLLSQAETPTQVSAADDDDDDGVREWRFPAHGFTLMAITTRFLARADAVVGADGKPTASFDVHLDAPDPIWASRLRELDYAVFSAGNWFFRVNYFSEGGRRVACSGCSSDTDAGLADFGVAHAVRRVVRAALEATARCGDGDGDSDCKRGLVAFVRTYTPSHFEHGSWFDGGYCNRTRPLEEAETPSWDQSIAWDVRRAQIEEVTTARTTTTTTTRFEVLDMTKAMMLRADGHPGRHYDKRSAAGDPNDCLHWCMPGPIDMWNDVLLHKIAEITSPPAPNLRNGNHGEMGEKHRRQKQANVAAAHAGGCPSRWRRLRGGQEGEAMGGAEESFPDRDLPRRAAGAGDPRRRRRDALRRDSARLGHGAEHAADIRRTRWRRGRSESNGGGGGGGVRRVEGEMGEGAEGPELHQRDVLDGGRLRQLPKVRQGSGYLYWRWRPDGCELPRFSPATFLAAVRGKRLAFIGDSLARNHMESLLCLLSQAETPTDMHAGAFVDAFRRWHFCEHDFTLMAVWTEFLVHAVPVVAGERTGPFDVHLDRINANWTRRLPELDYAVISNGNWFFRANYLWEGGRRVGCVDCSEPGVTHFPMAYAVGRVVGAALEAIAGCTGCKSELVTFVRTYTPDHFEHGSWFSGGYCNRTRPLEEAEVSSDAIAWVLRAAQTEEVRKVREKTTTTTRRRFCVVDVMPAMMMRADGHPGEHHHRWRGRNANDCLHLCLPGPIDMWNDVLLRRLAELSPPSSDAR